MAYVMHWSGLGGATVKKGTLFCVAAALNLTMVGAACSSAKGNEGAVDGRSSGSGDEVTIAGCLTAGPEGRFALTAAPDAAVSTAARAMNDERDTHNYVLVGGDNLQAHLGKRVEVVGTVAGKTQEVETDASKKTATAENSRGDTPTVKTTEEVDIEVRQLNVREVRALAPTCTVNP
jgi:hypothetical protein